MRHLRKFEESNSDKQNYCLFIAPRLHDDTVNTFWNSVKYEYEGEKQKIIPITISQLILLLEGVKKIHSQGNRMLNNQLKSLFDDCTNIISVKSSKEWIPLIDTQIKELVAGL